MSQTTSQADREAALLDYVNEFSRAAHADREKQAAADREAAVAAMEQAAADKLAAETQRDAAVTNFHDLSEAAAQHARAAAETTAALRTELATTQTDRDEALSQRAAAIAGHELIAKSLAVLFYGNESHRAAWLRERGWRLNSQPFGWAKGDGGVLNMTDAVHQEARHIAAQYQPLLRRPMVITPAAEQSTPQSLGAQPEAHSPRETVTEAMSRSKHSGEVPDLAVTAA